MLRPKVHIGVLKYSSSIQSIVHASSTNISAESINAELFKYIIKPHDINVVENRTGITCTINTKHDRYDIKRGDKMLITMNYENVELSRTRLPLMVITSVNIDKEGTIAINAIDEFQYICQTTNFVPVNPTKLQQKFLAEYMGAPYKGFTPKIKDIKFKEMIGYIQSLILPQSYYYSTNSKKIDFVNGWMLTNLTDLEANIGKWEPNGQPTIAAVLDMLKNNFFYNFFSFASSINATKGSEESKLSIYDYSDSVLARTNVLITGLDTCSPYTDVKEHLRVIDNFNVVDQNLIYVSPGNEGRAVQGVFKTKKDKEKKIKESTEVWYAYFDTDGTVLCQKDIAIVKGYAKFFDNITINDAATISTDDRKKYVTNKLLSTQYTGFSGDIKTFNMNFNVFDRVQLEFNNIDQQSEFGESEISKFEYGINEITRSFGEDGLFMTIKLRQQLKIVGDKWVNFNQK